MFTMSIILLFGILIIFILAIYMFAAMKKGSSDMEKPNKLKSFTTTIALDKCMKTIIKFAQNNEYKVDDFNDRDAIIILSDSTSLMSYGNLYPIYLSKHSDSTLFIEVGIRSKATQIVGLDAPHSRCFNGIRSAIFSIENEKSTDNVLSINSNSLNSLFCSYCGKPNTPNENKKFCDGCGHELKI